MGYIDKATFKLEDMLDDFSIGALTMREEAERAAQCFDDARAFINDYECYCAISGGGLDMGAPRADVDAAAQSGLFRGLLSGFGINSAEELSRISGVELVACEAAYSEPINCPTDFCVKIIIGLEDSIGEKLWSTPYAGEGITAGAWLYSWLRENFTVPFWREAAELKIKLRLLGAVGSLSDSEISNLFDALAVDSVSALKGIAATQN